jgi:hypothetical protein
MRAATQLSCRSIYNTFEENALSIVAAMFALIQPLGMISGTAAFIECVFDFEYAQIM